MVAVLVVAEGVRKPVDLALGCGCKGAVVERPDRIPVVVVLAVVAADKGAAAAGHKVAVAAAAAAAGHSSDALHSSAAFALMIHAG